MLCGSWYLCAASQSALLPLHSFVQKHSTAWQGRGGQRSETRPDISAALSVCVNMWVGVFVACGWMDIDCKQPRSNIRPWLNASRGMRRAPFREREHPGTYNTVLPVGLP